MQAQDYSGRYEPIITAWEAPASDSFGEQVRLMDGAVRFVRKGWHHGCRGHTARWCGADGFDVQA